ncbi:MAG TPA: hypothetical protein VI636_09695 [Candidatus Angelobacter sp.]
MVLEHVKDAADLVILCCHGVYNGKDFTDPFTESRWVLLSYQKGDPPWYQAHMRHAIERTSANPKSVLVVSGGQTRFEGGQISESGSYWKILESLGWNGHPEVKQRATTEEFATDSFQNLLFGICRYREVVGRYPEHIEVVTWAFKSERFDLHRAALRWPVDRFSFAGIGYPDARSVAEEGENRVLQLFRADPYGVGSVLALKRAARNPFRRQHGYCFSCPEIRALLEHSGSQIFPGKLPWNSNQSMNSSAVPEAVSATSLGAKEVAVP